MQNKETQQFAKFFLKDMKPKSVKYQKKNFDMTDLNSSTAS